MWPCLLDGDCECMEVTLVVWFVDYCILCYDIEMSVLLFVMLVDGCWFMF